MEIRTIAKISLLIFLYSLVYAFYVGLLHPIPALGDSWDYHIPISQSILNGTFINLSHFTTKTYFAQLNPGSSEAINSLLILLHIPLTLSNILAIVVLFFCCFFLALKFKLQYYYALLFAVAICSLTAISRWFNSVSIDVWMAVWFTLSIILLETPKRSYKYYLLLGIIFGMLVGSKYSSWPFLFILLIIYGKSLVKTLSFTRFAIFLIPFLILGIFWYVRNYLAVGNPVWPICLLWFPCTHAYETVPQMWNTTLLYPVVMLNAFFGEYKLWGFSVFVFIIPLVKKLRAKKSLPKEITKLSFMGATNFIFLIVAPTAHQPWIMVSSFRYSYPMFIPLILSVFLLATYYKKETWLGYFTIANMLPVLTMNYYPKLIFFYLPLAIVGYRLLNKYERKLDLQKK
jgi:hypothetical protein